MREPVERVPYDGQRWTIHHESVVMFLSSLHRSFRAQQSSSTVWALKVLHKKEWESVSSCCWSDFNFKEKGTDPTLRE